MSEHITANPSIQHGALCIAGTRFPVETIHNWTDEGYGMDEIVSSHSALKDVDPAALQAALDYPYSEFYPAWGNPETCEGIVAQRGYRPGYVVLELWSDAQTMDEVSIPVNEIERVIAGVAEALRAAAGQWTEGE